MKTSKHDGLKDLWHCPVCERTYPPTQHQYRLGEPDICQHCGSQGCTPYPPKVGRETHPWSKSVECSCGTTVSPGEQFCPDCHAQICPHCHIRMRWSCDKCGWWDEAMEHDPDKGWVDRHGHTANDVKRIKAAVALKRSQQIWEDNPEEWN